MDEMYIFGRSVDVDGDEWIDLGLPSDVEEVAKETEKKVVDEVKNEMKKVKKEVEVEVTSELMPKLEEIQETDDIKEVKRHQVKEFKVDVKNAENPSHSADVAAMKARQSKEALMAFYLGRAKQMEVKSKKILVSSTTPVVIRSLRESGRSAPIGL